jgi:hypothetical protein
MCADDKSFGLTDEEDIRHAIADGNRKYRYGGCGYVDEDGNHYRFPIRKKPKGLRSRLKPNPNTKRPSVEEVAIAIGLVSVIKRKSQSGEVKQ